MTALTAWQRVQLWGTNVLIAVALCLMLVQTFPGVPEWFSWRPRAVADALGLWQNTWSMFTPDPDNENHRLRAVLEYHDGRRVEWHSPEWSEVSSWQRFVGHRECEYVDNIRTPFYQPALPGFAAWLLRTHRQDPSEAGRPKHIEIHALYYDIADPRLRGWKVRSGPPVYEHGMEIYREDFP